MEQSSDAKYQLSLSNFSDYLAYKIPVLTVFGGTYGVGLGYYTGGLAALYGYGYGLGLGVGGSAFYGTTFLLAAARKQEDALNYAISGALNAAWMVTGAYGPRRGGLGAIGGAFAGALYHIIGGYSFQLTKNAWIEHRRFGLYKSRPKTLTIRKPQFAPGEGLEYKREERRRNSIIPAAPSPASDRSK